MTAKQREAKKKKPRLILAQICENGGDNTVQYEPVCPGGEKVCRGGGGAPFLFPLDLQASVKLKVKPGDIL